MRRPCLGGLPDEFSDRQNRIETTVLPLRVADDTNLAWWRKRLQPSVSFGVGALGRSEDGRMLTPFWL
jgi:hypothetical protein